MAFAQGLSQQDSQLAADKAVAKLMGKPHQRLADRKVVKAVTDALIKNRALKSYPMMLTMALEILNAVYPDIRPEKFKRFIAGLERQADRATVSKRTA